MDYKLIGLLLLAVVSLVFAEYFTINMIQYSKKSVTIEEQTCREAGGIPAVHTYIRGSDDKMHLLCLNPSTLIEFRK